MPLAQLNRMRCPSGMARNSAIRPSVGPSGRQRAPNQHVRGQLQPARSVDPAVLIPSPSAIIESVEQAAEAVQEAVEDMRLKNTRVAVFSAQQYVKGFLQKPMLETFPKAKFIEPRLDEDSAYAARGCSAAVAFVNDDCSRPVLEVLKDCGVKILAMRCTGYDKVDLKAADELGIKVARVLNYSPSSVAEHAVALMFTLVRHTASASLRCRQGNYSLNGLVGFEMRGKTVGVIGTGAIGYEACRILKGIGCRVIGYDMYPSDKAKALGVEYVTLDQLLAQSDIISLHCPLLPSTKHIINKDRLYQMKRGAMLINVSRGGLVDTSVIRDALEDGQLGALGMDTKMDIETRMKNWDRQFTSLLTYPQVVVTPHIAFLTDEALDTIATVTIQNIANYVLGESLGENELKYTPKK